MFLVVLVVVLRFVMMLLTSFLRVSRLGRGSYRVAMVHFRGLGRRMGVGSFRGVMHGSVGGEMGGFLGSRRVSLAHLLTTGIVFLALVPFVLILLLVIVMLLFGLWITSIMLLLIIALLLVFFVFVFLCLRITGIELGENESGITLHTPAIGNSTF